MHLHCEMAIRTDDKWRNAMDVRLTSGEIMMVNNFNMMEYRIYSNQTYGNPVRDHLDTQIL